MSYTPTIGLEVHAELNTVSKMFCGCKNQPHESEPNSHICPVCLAHPGTLPVPNEQAIEMVLMFGQAVGAQVATFSEFDRKNYFYPDIPKAYQISQYAFPFLSGGKLEGVELTRVHLEEDTARSQHDKGAESLVDFNRAGVPLMELVTEPVIHDAQTAGRFARELQLLLRTLKISDANMERGEMRVEANISVSQVDGELGTKVEVKNLNSFRSVESAIAYEIHRQTELLENGDKIIQETRGWDEAKLKTFSQRSKETAKDYRYFPDPDIPKIYTPDHTSFHASVLAEKIPLLPSKKREKYENLGLTRDTIEIIISDPKLDIFYGQVTNEHELSMEEAKLAANYLTSDVAAIIDSTNLTLDQLSSQHFVELIAMLVKGEIGSRVAKDLLSELFDSDVSPRAIATERNLLQKSDTAFLQPMIEKILTDHKEAVNQYKEGKESAIQFLVGQGMKQSKGAANPAKLRHLIEEAIKK